MSRNEKEAYMSRLIYSQKKPIKKDLPLDNDTEFQIIFDVLEDNYLYILLKETTARAPFYYNKSFTLEELCDIHKIFKACNDLQEVKKHIESLFDERKIKIYLKNNGEIIEMYLDVTLFCTNYKIKFDLFREMVPKEKKDDELKDLYLLNKKNLLLLKDAYKLVQKENSLKNNEFQSVLADILKLMENSDIPGLGLKNFNPLPLPQPIPEKNDDVAFSYYFVPPELGQNGEINIGMHVINNGNKIWPNQKTCFVCNKEKSNNICDNTEPLMWDVGKNEDADFYSKCKNNGPGIYKVVFNLKIEEKIYYHQELQVTFSLDESNDFKIIKKKSHL